MIIELDASLVALAILGGKGKDLVVDKLELLSIAQREGNHIVFSEVDVAERLLEIVGEERQTIASLLKRIINQYPKIAALACRVGRKLLVGDFDSSSIQLDNDIIKCPIAVVDSNMIQKSYLLVENLTDANFYSWITKSVIKDSSLNSVTLGFEAYQGGGDTTASAYAHLKSNTKRLCLCIVDSDVRAPTLSVGATPGKVLLSDLKQPSPITCAHVISVCSIENLIPFSFFERAWAGDINYKERLGVYRLHHREDHWRYLQLKKHIKCFEVHGGGVFSKYWGRALSTVKKGCDGKICDSKKSCPHNQLDQLSAAPMTTALTQIGGAYGDLSELLPDVRKAWEDIASQILDWCCAPAASPVA
ncbi:hypothetical protein [Pseudomonas viridiflava]|uniref:hypothetical protein n=1 Tax=Pseudomonas viridiflava TaxID=33069 RepID=UPI000F060B28|nr:hypothetical protein [Pseudomonas viridiflava]